MTKDKNINRRNIIKNFCKFVSCDSSGLPEFDPFYWLSGPARVGPKISSHVKFRVNKAGKRPRPITKPPCEFPNNEFPLGPMPKPPPRLKF